MWVALLALVALLHAPGIAAQAQAPAPPPTRRVVILLGADPALPALRQFDDTFRRELRARVPGATFFTDTFDGLRFDYATVRPEFLALQRRKYAAQPADLVVGVGDGAVEFLREHAGDVWPGAAVLLTGVDEARIDLARLPPGIATLLWRLDIDGTLALAEALQPAARRMVIIGGTADFDRAMTARVQARAAARGRWQIDLWTGTPLDELPARVATLDRGTVLVWTSVLRDAQGRATFSADALEMVAARSGAPVYGLYATLLGRGAVAGSPVDFADMGRRSAAAAVALLDGQPAPPHGTLPLTTGRCVADHAQLARHRLSPSALPADCILLNPPRNLWTEYRWTALGAAAVVTLQALTIATLLWQRRRRREAEAEALRRRTELARAMRFAAIGELTASIAHEINQPLGAILANADAAELLIEGGVATTADLREILADIRRDDLRAHEVIRRLRALLEKHDVEHLPVRLHRTLGEVLSIVAPEARRRGVTVERVFHATDDRLLGDPIQLQQVLLNLAINAMDAMDDTPAGQRALRIATANRDDALELSVADRGPGIEAGRRSQVFESFHTTKPRGLGLGLPIVRAIVEAHHGEIVVGAHAGGGAVFTVTLPRRLVQPADVAAPSASALLRPDVLR